MSAPLHCAVAAAAILVGLAHPAAAQIGCTERRLADPPRVAFDCGGGILIEREAAARMGLPVDDGAAGVPTVSLSRGAALVRVEPRSGGFQVRTPHAIAAVRGTTFIVDVAPSGTSVFVADGTVSVTGAGSAVRLGAGEGVDVPSVGAAQRRRLATGDAVPLRASRWGAARAAALLSRFGR